MKIMKNYNKILIMIITQKLKIIKICNNKVILMVKNYSKKKKIVIIT